MSKWRVTILFFVILGVVGGVSFVLGRLFTKTAALEQMAKGHQEIIEKLSSAASGFISTTSALEQTIEGHNKIIKELSNTTVVLGKIVEGHYNAILDTTVVIKNDMTTLRTDMIEKIDLIQKDINKLRNDISNLILKMDASKPSEAND